VLVLVGVSGWLTRTHQPAAVSWWLLSAAVLCFALRRTFLLAGNPALVPALRSFPLWSQGFFLPELLFLFLAFLLLPTTTPPGQSWLVRLRVVLDSLVLMSAAALLSWDFLLRPMYLHPGPSRADQVTNLALVLAGLRLLFLLMLLLVREQRLQVDRLVLGLLILAVLLVVIGNFWLALLLELQTRRASSAPPDAFWLLGYLVIPLAGLVQVRLAQWGAGPPRAAPGRAGVEWQDVLDCLRFMLPFVVGVVTSVLVILYAFLKPTLMGTPLPAVIAGVGLLALLIMRQGVVYLERVRLQREQAAARGRELALAEVNRQMETFVMMASHELRTPLTSMTLYQQQALRRLQRLKPEWPSAPPDVVQAVQRCEYDLLGTQAQLKRHGRLINELLDVSRLQGGQLDLQLELGELQAIVRGVVEEQRAIWSERSIQLCRQKNASASGSDFIARPALQSRVARG
jgi:signal transduction histidine kinase